MSTVNRLLEAALWYASLGLPVFPNHSPVLVDGQPVRCSCGNAECEHIAKHPRTAHGFKDATTDPEQIRAWWAECPTANIGLATGSASGCFVLDVDTRTGGDVTLLELEERHGRLPHTIEALTGGGGRHLLFKHPGSHVKSRSGVLPGLDIKGDGGYIIVEPSRHESGKEYAWELSSRPGEVTLADAPEWLLALVREPAPTERPTTVPANGGVIPEGQRNSTLASLAGTMRKRGMSVEAINAALMAENVAKCRPMLSEGEVERIVQSISRYEPGGSSPPQAEGIEAGGLTLRVLRIADRNRVVVSAQDASGSEVHRDNVNPDSSVSRSRFASEAATKANLDAEAAALMEAALMKCERPPERPTATAKQSPRAALEERDERSEAALAEVPKDIRDEAEDLLADPGLIARIQGHIELAGVVGERDLALTLYLLGTSRLLAKPVSAQVQGTTSSGKSMILDVVAGLMPGEGVFKATHLTANALYYTPYGALMHTWVAAGERSRREDDDQADATRALREMISAGELTKALPIKMPDGTFSTLLIHQPGPIGYVESTTNTNVFDEDANRMMPLSTDESPEQTARVVHAIAAAAQRESGDSARVVMLHQTVQRLLRRVRVRVPFAMAIAAAIPTSRPEARRSVGFILGMVRAVALLHQRQRREGPIIHGDCINAALEDYSVARELLVSPLGRSLGGSLSEAVVRFGKRMQVRFGGEQFTSTQALEADPVIKHKGKINQYLGSLADAGVSECVSESKGRQPATWKLVKDLPAAGATWLPSAEQIAGGQS
ncbi:hypothetical protein PHYC_02202 [Phycisphaerales bacterium]|nr:hypothetical protein PHYC_02202 [Phycisphaerales bacterium]